MSLNFSDLSTATAPFRELTAAVPQKSVSSSKVGVPVETSLKFKVNYGCFNNKFSNVVGLVCSLR